MEPEEIDAAIKKLKSIVTSLPVLVHPGDNEGEFLVETDASKYQLGAVLIWQDRAAGVCKPVAYASRLLKEAELNYSVPEKEALGVVWALEKWKVYLMGRKVDVFSDQQSLKWMMAIGANSRLVRWAIRLMAFDFRLHYKKGIHNRTADMLSRLRSGKQGKALVQSAHCRLLLTCAARETEGSGQRKSRQEVRKFWSDARRSAVAAGTKEGQEKLVRWWQKGQENDKLCQYLLEAMGRLNWAAEAGSQEVGTGEEDASQILEEIGYTKAMVEGWARRCELGDNDRLLYYRLTLNNGMKQRRLVVPRDYQAWILYLCHCSRDQVHIKRDLTIRAIADAAYWWPGWTRDAASFVDRCFCQEIDGRGGEVSQLPAGGIRASLRATRPLQVMAVDVAGPLNLINERGRTIDSIPLLVMVDMFTGLVWIEAMPRNYSRHDIMEILKQRVFDEFGQPECLLSDNASVFTAGSVAAWCKDRDIDQKFIVARRPQSNGMAERMVRRVKQALILAAEGQQEQWPALIGEVQLALRARFQEARGGSPMELFCGLSPRTMAGALATPQQQADADAGDLQELDPWQRWEWKRELAREIVKRAYELVPTHPEEVHARVKEQRCFFVKGDVVVLKKPRTHANSGREGVFTDSHALQARAEETLYRVLQVADICVEVVPLDDEEEAGAKSKRRWVMKNEVIRRGPPLVLSEQAWEQMKAHYKLSGERAKDQRRFRNWSLKVNPAETLLDDRDVTGGNDEVPRMEEPRVGRAFRRVRFASGSE